MACSRQLLRNLRLSPRTPLPLRKGLLHIPSRAITVESSKHSLEGTRISTLSNGLRVATEPTLGHFLAVGVYVDTGSRYETRRTTGVSHILDRLAFKSTTNHTTEELREELEAFGGNFSSSSSREAIMYHAAIFPQELGRVIQLLGEVIQHSKVTPEEVEEQKQTALYEIEEIFSKPEMILPEILHSVAYDGNTLGNPLLCLPENLPTMSSETIRDFMHTWYRPERIVVAAAGAPHELVVRLAEESFGNMPRSSPQEWLDSVETHADALKSSTPPPQLHIPSLKAHSAGSAKAKSPSLYKSLTTAASSLLRHTPDSPKSHNPDIYEIEPTPSQLARLKSHYTGGYLQLSNPSLPHTHIYLALEGLSIRDDDVYALATLQILLGGGGSFSAGGPGKGLHTRLFTNVLNYYHWVESCISFNHIYTDSGLFGISASCEHSHTAAMIEVICHELGLLARSDVVGSVTEVELSRARNQLKSLIMMNLESRMVQLEDLGRQVQVHGEKISLAETCARISNVTLADLRRVAARIIHGNSPPSCVIQGDLRGVPDVAKIFSRYGIGKSS